MNELISTPIFGLFLTLGAIAVSMMIKKWFRLQGFFTMLLSTIIIIMILLLGEIEYEAYKKGGDLILSFLGPITVVLAVPLYQHHERLKKYFVGIIIGVLIGSTISISSILLMGMILDLEVPITNALLVHSITTPIAIDSARMVDGLVGLTVLSVVITGIFGSLIAPWVFKVLKITDPIAKGVSIGTSSHAIGTAKAFEIGEVEGAMSGLSIAIAGITTVVMLTLLQMIGWI